MAEHFLFFVLNLNSVTLLKWQARMDILKIHTKQWIPPPSESFLEELADKCVGMLV